MHRARRTERDQPVLAAVRRYRADLRAAFKDCAPSIPCWIMPTWRVSQCLPAAIGSFDLVVLDEASQSDIPALLALLRGAQVLVVGDGKQVSPTSAFIAEERIQQLRKRLTKRHPYPDQLLPGKSIFDLAKTCYGDASIALSEHFRCVPACIAFSNEKFYHGNLLPRRLPPRSQRLEPPIASIFVPHAKKTNKVNVPEAETLVQWLKAELASDARLREASVAVISLGGAEQTRKLRQLVLANFSDAEMARHQLVVGDPSSFQGGACDVHATRGVWRSPRGGRSRRRPRRRAWEACLAEDCVCAPLWQMSEMSYCSRSLRCLASTPMSPPSGWTRSASSTSPSRVVSPTAADSTCMPQPDPSRARPGAPRHPSSTGTAR